MNTAVKLKELIDEMQSQMDEWTTYLCKRTGEFVMISDEEFRAAEAKIDDEDNEAEDEMDIEDDDGFLDVDEDQVKIAIDIMENYDDYIKLPSQYEIHEYEIMERFCWSIANEKERNILSIAIKGSGAFRRFKDMIRELGVEEDWYTFKDEEYKEIAIEWCNDNGIKYEE
jgi:hypothetical protein